MSVKYSWSRQNGAAVPPVRFMSIEPAEDYYKGMPLKLKEKGIVEPTDGDPEYICMAQYDPDAEIQPLEIPVQEVFPDVVYDRMNDDGTIEEVRFGSKGGGGGDLLETVETEVPLEITFDGNIEGKETVDTGNNGILFVKVSNTILTVDMAIGSTIDVIEDGVDNSHVLSAENITDMTEYGLPAYTILTDRAQVAMCILEDVSTEGMAMSAGVWFSYRPDGLWVTKSLTCPNVTTTTTKQQLKPSLLPPHKHKWDDIEDAICWDRSKSEPLNFEFNGNLDNYEIVDTDGMFVVKVSDSVLTMDDLIGGTVLIVDGDEEREVPVTNEKMVDMGASAGVPLIMIHNGDSGGMGSPFVMVMYGTSEQMPLSLGVWFVYQDEIHYTKSLSNPNVTITTGELKKIDPKFYDQPCYETVVPVWSADNLEFQGDNTAAVKGWAEGEEPFVPVVGNTYLVKWDGVEYKCVAKEVGDYIIVGNSVNMDDVDTGEPFSYSYQLGWTFLFDFVTKTGEPVTHNVSFEMEGVTPLPEKFMPELTQVILISPGGKKFKTTVDDTGQLVTTEV